MTRLLRHAPLLRLLPLLWLASLPAAAQDATTPLPGWQVLEYEQQAFFVTAQSRVELLPDAQDSARWQLTAASSVASNSEEVVLELAAADGRASYRSRLSKGKEQRFKTYDFLPEHIVRVRRDPPADGSPPPGEWPVTSRREIPYPAAAQGLAVTDAYALLALADRFRTSGETSAQVVINTEFNFYKVTMTHSDTPVVEARYQLADKTVSGSRPTTGVAIEVEPMGKLAEKPDFSLLGLEGNITVLFDQGNGLPLQLRGDAPRLGRAEINLKAVTLREPSA
jgi:hypothetical protein